LRRRLSAIPPRRLAQLILAAAVIAYYVVAEWIVPLPFYSLKYDPEMAYFMNSLALFKGVPYMYIDHPGTPVEVIGSMLLALTRPWTRAFGALFIPYHLANPQVFLALAHGFVTLASVVCVILLARHAVTGESPRAVMASVAVAVCFFAAYPSAAFGVLTGWSHNSFAFSFGTLFLGVWAFRLRRETDVSSMEAVIAGAMAGLLAAVQLYFLAWGLGLVVGLALYGWFRGNGGRAVAARAIAASVGLAAGFSIGFAPVMFRFREFYLWVDRLLFHQGRYGGGSEGVVEPERWFENLRRLWPQSPWTFIMTFLIVGLVFVAMRAGKGGPCQHPAWWASALSLLSMLALVWWAIGKHPGTHYLVAVAAVLPLLLGLALEVLVRREGWGGALAIGAGGLIVASFAVGGAMSAAGQARTARQIAAAEEILERTFRQYAARLGKDRAQLTILWGYGVPSRCMALRFGDLSTGLALEDEVDALCPNEWAYEVWGGYVQYPGAHTMASVRRPWDLIIVPGRALPLPSEEVGGVLDTGLPTPGYGTIQILTPPAAP